MRNSSIAMSKILETKDIIFKSEHLPGVTYIVTYKSTTEGWSFTFPRIYDPKNQEAQDQASYAAWRIMSDSLLNDFEEEEE